MQRDHVTSRKEQFERSDKYRSQANSTLLKSQERITESKVRIPQILTMGGRKRTPSVLIGGAYQKIDLVASR